MQEVTASSAEQASGVSQINKAMARVDQVTQRNAAQAEELSSTSEEMASQAEALRTMMAFFKLAEAEVPAEEPAVPGPVPGRRPERGARPAPAGHEVGFRRF